IWLELDVQLVEDKLIVFHDERLERTTNGQGLVSETSLCQLRKLDAGQGERIPLLSEVLALCAGRARVNIELKGNNTAVATAKLLTELFAAGSLMPDEVLASSLRLKELSDFQHLMPGVRCAPIFEFLPDDLAAQLERFAAWSVHLHKSLITEDVIDKAQQQNCRVFAWTVNRFAEMKYLKKMGIEGIFTDYPARFIREN
ncbi:MAG: hypothetical protein L3J63_07485, partial [Geopsychrobacter sp.]|nr:hypothetical protein [Geopsychrobacter sp.]